MNVEQGGTLFNLSQLKIKLPPSYKVIRLRNPNVINRNLDHQFLSKLHKTRQDILAMSQSQNLTQESFNETIFKTQTALLKTDNNVIRRESDENVVKSLDKWETEHYDHLSRREKEENQTTIADFKKRVKMINMSKARKKENFNHLEDTKQFRISKRDHKFLEADNALIWHNEIKEHLSKFNLKNTNANLKEFYLKNEQEEGCILLHDLNLAKRNFDFKIFEKSKKNLSMDYSNQNKYRVVENELVLIGKQLALRKKDSRILSGSVQNCIILVDDPFLKFHNLKLEGNYEKMISTDYYRKIITQKANIENSFRMEFFKLHKKLDKKKKLKQKLKTENAMLLEKIELKKEQWNQKVEEMEQYKLKYIESDTAKRLLAAHSLSSKKKPKMSLSRSMSFENASRLLVKLNEFSDIVEVYKTQYDEVMHKYPPVIQRNTEFIAVCSKEIDDIKTNMARMIREQTRYYFAILKKGIDVRTEGLSWVVRRIVELGSIPDCTHFPRFLEASQIEYILNISAIQLEMIRYKVVFLILKKKYVEKYAIKPGDLKLENNEDNYPTSDLGKTVKMFFHHLDHVMQNHESDKNHQSLCTKVFNCMEKALTANMKTAFDKKIEDNKTDQIILQLKKNIRQTDTLSIVPSIFPNAGQHQREQTSEEQELIMDMMELKNKITEMEARLTEIKSEEMKQFKAKCEILKNGGISQSMQYDLMYSSLFGNSVTV